MKKELLTAMLACGCLLPAAAQQHLYVSPQGNDQWNGEKSTPFQSIERAIEAATSGTDTLYIEVAAGDYPLSRPLHFGPSVRRPVVVRGSGQSMPRLLGGRRIEGWQRYRDNIYRPYGPARPTRTGSTSRGRRNIPMHRVCAPPATPRSASRSATTA